MNRILLAVSLLFSGMTMAQTKGCMDPQATNYNKNATENDGSCLYKNTFFSPVKLCPVLSDTVQETSGLCYFNGMFWTHNDSDNPPLLYAFDSLSGRILHQIYIKNATNIDWEDITHDKDYVYIGDFGNNSGTRKNLRILKIKKSDIHLQQMTDSVNAEFINFSMSDQTDFSDRFINNDHDIEALISFNDSLHIFTKNWVDKKTRHYVCPKDSGTYSLTHVETIDVGGQISGATVNASGIVMLLGYTKPTYPCFAWIFWDYSGSKFNTGNKRKIDMGNTLYPGQTEGIALIGNRAYITNEYKIIQPQLLKMDIGKWLDSTNTNSIQDTFTERTKVSYNNHQLKIWSLDLQNGLTIDIYDNTGKKVHSYKVNVDANGNCEPVEIELPDGIYFVKCQKVVLGKIISY